MKINQNSLLYKITCNPLYNVFWSEPYDVCSFFRQFSFGFALRYLVLGILTLTFTFITMVIVGMGYEIADSEINGFLNHLVNIHIHWKDSMNEMMNYFFDSLSFGYETHFVGTWNSFSIKDLWLIYLGISIFLSFAIFVLSIIFSFVLIAGCLLILIAEYIVSPTIRKFHEYSEQKMNNAIEKNDNLKFVVDKHSKFCTKINYE